MIVLDTHALIWTVTGDRKLGRKTRRFIERLWKDGLVAVSAMSFWEAALLHAKGRLSLTSSAHEWRAERLSGGLIELPVDGSIGVRAVELGELPDDPADRLIVATTLHHRAELVTGDERLLKWKHSLVRYDARD